MTKEIKYNGYTANPSDYQSPDGDLALSLGLIQEDGTLRPLLPPSVTKITVDSGNKIYLHKTGSYTHVLEYSKNEIHWVATGLESIFDDKIKIFDSGNSGDIIDIKAMGNILIVSLLNGLNYIRFNPMTSSYLDLGKRIPKIDLEFALKLNFISQTINDTNLSYTLSSNNSVNPEEKGFSEIYSLSYKFVYPNGNVSLGTPEFYEGSTQILYSEKYFLEFDIKKNVDYKFFWFCNTAPVHAYWLTFYGRKSKDSEYECIFSFGVGDSSASVTKIETFTNDYYDVFFYITRTNGNSVSTSGSLVIYERNSAVDDGDVNATIDYTLDNYNALTAKINKFINENNNNKFIYPFFVRYAVKSYSGEYIHISHPIFLVPNSGYVPAVYYDVRADGNELLKLSAFCADLQYRIKSQIDDNWVDLISGIDIFVSQPIWTYNQGSEFDEFKSLFKHKGFSDSVGVGIVYKGSYKSETDYSFYLLKDSINKYADMAYLDGCIEVAPRNLDDIMKDVASIENFYKIATLPTTTLTPKESFTDLTIGEDALSSLVSKPTLKDDCINYPDFYGTLLTTYNSRLILSPKEIVVPDVVAPVKCNGYVDGECIFFKLDVYVLLKTDCGEKIVRLEILPEQISDLGYSWFFYPDSRAYSLVFIYYESEDYIYRIELPLKPHDFLNGAYWVGKQILSQISEIEKVKLSADPFDVNSISKTIPYSSSYFCSEVNNPFAFKVDNCKTIGCGNINKLVSSAKALSQGQFGQFPLYAFTDEGIWAMEISSTGVPEPAQPITRDVVLSPDSITQIDSAVLFATDRGIMLISGSQTQCISDVINDDNIALNSAFSIRYSALIDIFNSNVDESRRISLSNVTLLSFKEFLKSCRMVYDYTNQHIIVYNKEVQYAYVFSLKSKQWGMMCSDIVEGVNSYPEALAMTKDNKLVNFSTPDSSFLTPHSALIITRPVKLDDPTVFKTVNTVIQRGMFRSTHVRQVLYGSNDFMHWHVVWSSVDKIMRGFRGAPYKAYRLAVVCHFDKGESIDGCTMVYEPRMTNQVR